VDVRRASGRTGPQALTQCSQYVVTVYSKAQTRHGQNEEWPPRYCHLRAAEECKTCGRERNAFALRMSATEEIPAVDGTRACERWKRSVVREVYLHNQKSHSIEDFTSTDTYKPKGRGFDSEWRHWNFSLTQSPPAAIWPWGRLSH